MSKDTRPLKETLASTTLIIYIVLTWLSVNFQNILPEYDKSPLYSLFVCITFNAIFAMCMACLYKLQTTPAGSPPSDWKPKPAKPAAPESPKNDNPQRTGIISYTTLYERYCTHCRIPKPERTQRCGKCILKMDHHCPYTNTCIGFFNYKFYFLLLLYGCIGILFVVVTQFSISWEAWKYTPKSFTEYSRIFMYCWHVFWLINVAMLLMFHIECVGENATTIEMHEFDQKNFKSKMYNLNNEDNWMSVLGLYPMYWFLPVDWGRVGDGLTFPCNEEARKHYSQRPDALLGVI